MESDQSKLCYVCLMPMGENPVCATQTKQSEGMCFDGEECKKDPLNIYHNHQRRVAWVAVSWLNRNDDGNALAWTLNRKNLFCCTCAASSGSDNNVAWQVHMYRYVI